MTGSPPSLKIWRARILLLACSITSGASTGRRIPKLIKLVCWNVYRSHLDATAAYVLLPPRRCKAVRRRVSLGFAPSGLVTG